MATDLPEDDKPDDDNKPADVVMAVTYPVPSTAQFYQADFVDSDDEKPKENENTGPAEQQD